MKTLLTLLLMPALCWSQTIITGGSRQVFASGPVYAPTLVGTPVGQDNTGTSSSTIVSPAHSHTAGNGIGVLIRGGAVGLTVSSVTNTAGDTFTRAAASYVSNGQITDVWYTCNTAGNASDVVTATLSASNSYNVMVVFEITNQNPASCLDTATNGTSTGGTNTVTSSSFTPLANDFIAAISGQDCSAGAWTAGTGYTILLNETGSGVGTEYLQGSTAGAQTASMVFNEATCARTISVAAFK